MSGPRGALTPLRGHGGLPRAAVLFEQEIREEIGVAAARRRAPRDQGKGARWSWPGKGTGHQASALEKTRVQRDLGQERHAQPAFDHLDEGRQARGLDPRLPGAPAWTARCDDVLAEAVPFLQ